MSTTIRCSICDDEAEYGRDTFVYYEIGYVQVPVSVCEKCFMFLVRDASNQLRKSRIRDTIRLFRGKDKL